MVLHCARASRARELRYKKKFVTSDYPEAHPTGIKAGINKEVIGKFKDEACGHFVGLRAKLYSFEFDGLNEEKK